MVQLVAVHSDLVVAWVNSVGMRFVSEGIISIIISSHDNKNNKNNKNKNNDNDNNKL